MDEVSEMEMIPIMESVKSVVTWCTDRGCAQSAHLHCVAHDIGMEPSAISVGLQGAVV